MLGSFTSQTFSPHVGDTFTLAVEGMPPVELQLISVTEVGALSSGRPVREAQDYNGRVPFSLLFRGQLDLYLPQQIYHFEHDRLGAMDIFIVPIGPDAQGMRFEAIFA